MSGVSDLIVSGVIIGLFILFIYFLMMFLRKRGRQRAFSQIAVAYNLQLTGINDDLALAGSTRLWTISTLVRRLDRLTELDAGTTALAEARTWKDAHPEVSILIMKMNRSVPGSAVLRIPSSPSERTTTARMCGSYVIARTTPEMESMLSDPEMDSCLSYKSVTRTIVIENGNFITMAEGRWFNYEELVDVVAALDRLASMMR